MSLTTTEGLIIKEQKVGESDRLVTILTKDKGVIRAFATNALKLKSKNLSATQLLSYSRLILYKSRDTYKINEAQTIDVFFNLRSDIDSLSLASYFCELAQHLAPEEDDAEDYLRLLLNALHLLCNKKRPNKLIKAVVELKICQLSGYMPNLHSCAKCNVSEAENMKFDVLHGVIFCGSCNTSSKTAISISKGILAAMRHILSSGFDKLFAFTLPDDALNVLSHVTERFVGAQTDRSYKTLDFYNSVQ